eukprot:5492709-Lingulodinium_polyedra.AAC.1
MCVAPCRFESNVLRKPDKFLFATGRPRRCAAGARLNAPDLPRATGVWMSGVAREVPQCDAGQV